ncbi:MAG: site-2 protease family protein [Ignavibacteria bacterium]|nr:site-2 protease family protein [Ignavibacteria bacterium]
MENNTDNSEQELNRLALEEEYRRRFSGYEAPKRKNNYLLHIGLFLLTFITTTLGGVYWGGNDPYNISNFTLGLTYSCLILFIISAHEFGHYFAAKIHKVDVTLPYYIPFPFLFLNPFGTMGAVIRMRSAASTRKALFDIGVSGPIAGWIASVVILIIGFTTLPSIEFLFKIHPDYAMNGVLVQGETFGYSILFWTFEKLFASPSGFMPPMNEVYHYPFLCAGWFGLLITALNMMPAGQLDGGHISYTMFGSRNSNILGHIVVGILFIMGVIGLLPLIDINVDFGSVNWLVWALLITFVIKIPHPPTVNHDPEPLSKTRMAIGWFTFLILILSFAPVPIYLK